MFSLGDVIGIICALGAAAAVWMRLEVAVALLKGQRVTRQRDLDELDRRLKAVERWLPPDEKN